MISEEGSNLDGPIDKDSKVKEEKQILDKRFEEWVSTNKDQAEKLEIPDEFLRVLVPEKVYEIAGNKENVEVMCLEDKGRLALVVIEHNYPHNLTSEKTWDEWLKTRQEAEQKQSSSRIKIYPEPPKEVNRLQAKFRSKIEQGILSLKDRILMSCDLHTEADKELLFVRDYDGEIGQGIANEFYTKTLPSFAKKIGLRFIKGRNNDENIKFFRDKLGRSVYEDFKPEIRGELFPDYHPDGFIDTIQFLYNEDNKKYLEENK